MLQDSLVWRTSAFGQIIKFILLGTLAAFLSLAFMPLKLVNAQETARKVDTADITLPQGYKIEAVITNLSVPTTVIFDDQDIIVAESGFTNVAKPRILRIKPDGGVTEIAQEGLVPPVTGLLMIEDQLYVSHGGKVSVVENGKLKDIVTGLPSSGDHQNNKIVLGQDGKIYMGQGTVTNSGVVGIDSHLFGWLEKQRSISEIPCKDITLAGKNFETENPLTPENDRVTTGAYKPFGVPSTEGEVIKGNPKCGGSIVRFNPDGSGFELVAWGLRNPYSVQFDNQGRLWSTFHGADVRGSRSIFNDPDYLVLVQQDGWYGWPEYFDGQPVTTARFNAPGEAKPELLWKDHPPLAPTYMTFDSHAGINGLAFSPGDSFGFSGDAFIAMFGTFAPVTTGINVKPAGFKVVKVNIANKEVSDFVTNSGIGPAYINRGGGVDRPSDVVFGPDQALYIVDWGAATLTDKGLELVPETGVVWRVYSDKQSALMPNGPVKIDSATVAKDQRNALVRNVPELYRESAPTVGILALVIIVAFAIIVTLTKRLKSRSAT